MADAIWSSRETVKTQHCLIVWGDQVLVSARTVRRCVRAHIASGASLTLPSAVRADPYIVFDRDREGRLVRVRQRREGEVHESEGESDCGIFVVRTDHLFDVLGEERASAPVGELTREWNFLPLLPCFERRDGGVVTVRIHDLLETQGVNTLEDAAIVERALEVRAR